MIPVLCACFASLFLTLVMATEFCLGELSSPVKLARCVSPSVSCSTPLLRLKWASIRHSEDLGEPRAGLVPVICSALLCSALLCSAMQGRIPGEEAEPPPTAASPVVAQPPPGGSRQVLLLRSPSICCSNPSSWPLSSPRRVAASLDSSLGCLASRYQSRYQMPSI